MSGMGWQRRWGLLSEFQREMRRLFEHLEPLQTMRVARQFPLVNLYDAGDRYVLTVPVPGTAPEELDLSITGETLTLRGDRKRPEDVADESYRRPERPFGRWTRTVTLPDRVDSTAVSDSYTLGVLNVTIPKAESARPRQIAVSAGG